MKEKKQALSNASNNKKFLLLIILLLVFYILIRFFIFKKPVDESVNILDDEKEVAPSTEIVNQANVVDCIKNDDGLCHYYVEKNKDSSYKNYTLVYPESWTLEVDQVPTLAKGPLKI